MLTSAATLHPRFTTRAIPITLLPLTVGPIEIQRLLGFDLEQMHPVGGAVHSKKIDVPPGEWLVWDELNFAMWIGARMDALPLAVRRRLEEGEARDVINHVNALADAGVWLREAALLIDDVWTPSTRNDGALAAITTHDFSAISGIFVDKAGRPSRLEVARGGVWWTDHPRLAVEWLLTAFGLSAPL
jgi:hypothetical protein